MHTVNIRLIALVLAAASLFRAQPASGADTLLYAQPPSASGSGGLYSERIASGESQEVWDNFTLTSNANIGVVTWEGGYGNSVTGVNGKPNSASFAISFWSDSGGKLGTVISTATIAFADLNSSLSGTTYHYTANLPTPFKAAGGTQYWVSILSNSTSLEPAWLWSGGMGGDGQCYNDIGSGPQPYQGDLTFSLLGSPLPEPTITVAATVPAAKTGQPGVFTFTSSEPAAKEIVIHYLLEGTAVDGQDYKFLNGIKRIKANEKTVSIKVVPKDARHGARKSRVKLVLAPASGYTVGTPKAAKIEILEP